MAKTATKTEVVAPATEKENKNNLISEGKFMKRARNLLKSKGYNPSSRQKILDDIRRDIPNSRNQNCKFLLGVTRMYLDGELNDTRTVAELNNTLHYITDDSHVNEYDCNLNGETANTLTERFKTVAEIDHEKDMVASAERTAKFTKNPDYTIVSIDTPEQAEKYGQYTSWCITHSDRMYISYTSEGAGRFFFCLKKGFEKLDPIRGEGCPLDEYGLSMIAVSITMDGDLNTLTCRWNHDNGGGDSIMTIEELEKLLGVSFYETFHPYTKEELKAKGKYVSDVIGKYYLNVDKEIEGIIASVDKNEKPTLIMSIDGPTERMTWHDAMKLQFDGGWHIPSKDELNDIWFIKAYNNIITKKLNRGIEKYNENIYNRLTHKGDKVVWKKVDGTEQCFSAHGDIIL